jgi:hypothetical protein
MLPQEIRALLKEIVRRKDKEGLHVFIKAVFGTHVPNVVIVPGHDSPFDFVADFMFDVFTSALVLANRSGGKTMDFAILDALSVFLHDDIEVDTVAAIEPQAKRCYGYFQDYMTKIPAFAWYVVSMTMGQTLTKTGCKMQVLTGTVSGVNSPHGQFVFIDEIDLMDWPILQQAFSMAQGKRDIPSKTVLTSTRKYKAGAMQRMINEHKKRGMKFYQWNIWEVVEALPLGDQALMDRIYEVFGDELPENIHKANGYYKWTDLIDKKLQLDDETWQSEWLCEKPGLEGVIYAKSFSDDRNIISKDWTPKGKRGHIYLSEDFGYSDDHPDVGGAFWLPPTFDRIVLFDSRYMRGYSSDDIYYTLDEMLLPYGHRLPFPKRNIKGTVAGWATDPAGATERADRRQRGAPIMAKHEDQERYRILNGISMIKKLLQLGIFMISARNEEFLDEFLSYSWKTNPDGLATDVPQKKFDHGCLVGGTLIATSEGQKTLRDVKVGDYVFTRKGLRQVTHWALTNPNAEIWRIETKSGAVLEGTHDHPVFTSRGWVALSELKPDDQIASFNRSLGLIQLVTWRLKLFLKQFRSSMGSAIICVIDIFSGMAKDCIELFGRTTMAVSPVAITSTTETTTGTTINLKTWRCLKKKLTSSYMGKIWTRIGHVKCSNYMHVQRLVSGINQRLVESGTRKCLNRFGSIRNIIRNAVLSALLSMKLRCRLILFFATKTVRQECLGQDEVVRVFKTSRRDSTFNITVEDQHEYYANGLLVSNCDMVRYLIILLYDSIMGNYLSRLHQKQTRHQPPQEKKTEMRYSKHHDSTVTGGIYQKKY